MTRIVLLAVATLALACDSSPDSDALKQAIGSAVQDNLAGLKDQQAEVAKAVAALDEKVVAANDKEAANSEKLDAIVEQLEVLQRKVDEIEIPAAPTPTPTPTPTPRPGRPDPLVTYKVPLGDAHTRGSDTALVTIVAWSDFQ
ncbi:MAG: hypothetical protein AAF721_30525 [Myxococcota bacterium]